MVNWLLFSQPDLVRAGGPLGHHVSCNRKDVVMFDWMMSDIVVKHSFLEMW
jgi:hypothetical protein